MSLDFKTLRREKEGFLVDDSADVYIPGGVVSANDMACFAAWFEISGASGGLGGAPGTVILEYTPDDGANWYTVPSLLGGSITGNGSNFSLQVTSATGIFPPVVRFKFSAPAGQYYVVEHIRRSYVTPGLVASLRSAFAPVVGFGEVTLAPRSAAMLGSIDKLPAPAATGYNYLTSTAFTKTLANDGRALDVNIATALSAAMQVMYNGALTTPTYSTATPANNKGVPIIFTAGDGLAPVAMGTGADSALTLRTTLSTRHETVTTPVAMRISDSTEFTTAHETYALNTQFTKAAQTLRLPVSAFLNGWDYTNNTRKELRADANGDLQVTLMNTVKAEYSSAAVPLFWNFATVGQDLTANAWKQIIAATAAKILRISWWNPTGEILEVGFGAGGAEFSKFIITIGDGNKEVLIPAGTRVSLRCSVNVASDVLALDFLA